MSDSTPTIHELALRIRADLDRELPHLGIVLNTCEESDGKGSITLTVSSWSKDLLMLNRQRLVDKRNSILSGDTHYFSSLPYLSSYADGVARQLQEIADRHFAFCTFVGFDPRSLERESVAFYQSLKTT